MRFKQKGEKEVKALDGIYIAFTDLLQIEEDKLSLIEAAKSYFYRNGNMQYKKFFKYLHKVCLDNKLDMQHFLFDLAEKTPERTIHSIKMDDLTDAQKIFDLLASAEDDYVDALNKAINEAFYVQDWNTFNYLLNKFNKLDHLCCRAAAAVKSGNTVLDLIPCEQHSLEK